jgi:hypothetical protein
MRFATIITSAAIVILGMMSTVFAQNEQREPLTRDAPTAATTNTQSREIATGSVPGLVTPEEENAIPYHACLNARGWVNGRLVCSESFGPDGRQRSAR